jgi:hypothetical protein
MTFAPHAEDLTSQVGGGVTVFNVAAPFNGAAALLFAGGRQTEATFNGAGQTATVTPALTVLDLAGGTLRLVAWADAVNVDCTSQVNGSRTTFTVGTFDGNGVVFVGGIQREVASFDGPGGTFSLVETLVVADLGGGTLRFFGGKVGSESVSYDLTAQVGSGTVFTIPLPYDESTALIFAGGIEQNTVMSGLGPTITRTPALVVGDLNGGKLRFMAVRTVVSLFGLDVTVVPNLGGLVVVAHGIFDISRDVAFTLVQSGVNKPCYSGQSGNGYIHGVPLDAAHAKFVLPHALTLGTWDARAAQGGFSSTLAAALTVVPRNWSPAVQALRRVLPPWYAAGVRNLDSVGLMG